MKNTMFFRVLLGSLFLALLFSGALPIRALADEGNPPNDPAPTEEPISTADEGATLEAIPEGTQIEEAAPVEESTPTEDVSPTLETLSDFVSAEDGSFDATIEESFLGLDSGPLLGDVPEGAEIVVFNDSGEALPLAVETAAEVLASGDPMWCPASVTPGSSSCSQPYNTLSALIDWLENNPRTVAGVIWVHKDYDSSTATEIDLTFTDIGVAEFSFNGIDMGSTANYALTIKGGWKGSGTGIDTTSPSLFNGASLEIKNWIGDVSLSDIIFANGTSGSTTMLQVQTSGKITLTRVEVSDNAGSGADLDNTAGSKDVSISNSTFSDNAGGDGLNVSSNGLITLSNVTATHNGGDGAHLNNVSLTLKGVTLLSTNIFSENLGDGLEINSNGKISLTNLVNDANSGFGLVLDNSGGTSPVTLSGSNEFKFNDGGLWIVSKGQITLNNVNASYNSALEGTVIDNSGGNNAGVSLMGSNVFNFNQLDGLRISSKGSISLNNITATANGQSEVSGYGVWLDNAAGLAKPAVINTGTFSDNFEGGLYVTSAGAITISKLTANGNQGSGAQLANLAANPLTPQSIVVTGFLNASLNDGAGIDIQSLGMISLAGVTANGNLGAGASLSAGKSVTISGTNSFNENGAKGLDVNAKGTITLSNISANGNTGEGAVLANGLIGAIGNIVITGFNDFSENHMAGLDIVSRGSVTIASLQAQSNLAKGISIDNSDDGTSGNVSLGTGLLNWCNEISGNSQTGLEISSNGAITLANICASGNGNILTPGFGAQIDNGGPGLLKPVTVNGINIFSGNYSGGLSVSSGGAITISNLTASNNLNGFGAVLDNAVNVNSPRSVNLKGSNHISANYGNGLTVTSFGVISISNLTASSNGANGGSGYGAWLDNCNEIVEGEGDCATAAPQSITLTGRNSFSSNTGFGLKALSLGAIKATNVLASSNAGLGAFLNNDFDGAIAGVILSGTDNFFGNNANGLQIISRRAISISNLEASYNTGFGATLENYASPPSPQNINISGYAIFAENLSGYGLSVWSLGAITISNLSASANGAQGAILDNAEPGATGVITLSGIQLLYNNEGTGLEVDSNRVVTISSVTASLNNGYGVSIDNRAAGLIYDVKLTGTNVFNENDLIGLEIHTFGAVALNNISAQENGVDGLEDFGHGVYLDNQTDAITAKPATLTGTNSFSENFETGLFVLSLGKITANSLSAAGNLGDGVIFDNSTGIAGIQLTGFNNFQGNSGLGLITLSRGVISLMNIVATLNQSGGADINNSGSAYAANVSITGINSFTSNGTELIEGTGLEIKSRGSISLSNLIANGNSFMGTRLDNQTNAFGIPLITISGVNEFSSNLSTGLFIQGGGKVTISKLKADGNAGDGVFAAAKLDVSLTCASLIGNEGFGLAVSIETGKVTLSGVFAFGNSDIYGNMSLPLGTTFIRACPLP